MRSTRRNDAGTASRPEPQDHATSPRTPRRPATRTPAHPRPDSELTLSHRLFLIACRLDGGVAGGPHLGLALNAAALQSLLDQGLVADDNGKVRVTARHAAPPAGRLEADLLARIADTERARTWRRWVGSRDRAAPGIVRAELAAQRFVKVDEGRRLGLFPYHHVTLRRADARRSAMAARDGALTGPLSDVSRDGAALAVLAHHGRLPRLATWGERRAAKGRIGELSPGLGPVPDALRRQVRDRRSSDGSGAG